MRFLPTLLLEQLDDRSARRRRLGYGRRGWLLSWHPLRFGGWQARLSCPEWPETVEANGPTRRAAIDRADVLLQEALRSAE
jgi:hypothetical protein